MKSVSSQKVVRLGIVGSGSIAEVHAKAVAAISEARVVAICSRNREKGGEMARATGAKFFDSLESFLASDKMDAVLIATPSGAHLEPAVASLQARKHVLCEKPMEITVARIRQMRDAAKKAGVMLAGFFPLRCGEGAGLIHQALEQGRFGQLTLLSARVKWWRNQDYFDASKWRGTWEFDGGGALMNQGIHAVDLLQWFGGPSLEALSYAARLTHPGIEVEDTLAACIHFKNGALGTIEAATSCFPGLDLSLEVSGEFGTAILVNDKIEFWQFAQERPGDMDIRSGKFGGKLKGGASDPKAISHEGHRQQIVGFCRAIRGDEAVTVSAEDAARSVAIIEAIYRSARSGKSEQIEIIK